MTTYITRSEAARMARVTPRTIDRWIRAGILTAHRAGPRRVLINPDELISREVR